MIINNYLKDNGITKYQFAKTCGLPYGTLNDICNGKSDIKKCSGETLLKIAHTIGTSVDDLLIENLNDSILDLNTIKHLITPVAKKHNLRSVYIFGSYARNEAVESSDIDILIDREGSDVRGMFAMNSLISEFKVVLGKDVDLVTLQSLNQSNTIKNNSSFVDNVRKDMVLIYG